MPIHNLYATPLSSIIFCGLSVSCSEYIFLQRIRAIYAYSPRVRRFFAIFWMVSLSSEILLLFSIKPVYIPNTQQFKDAGVQPLMCLTIVTAIAFDSSVFLAISYKIGIAHIVIDREMGWKRFITGKALPRLSQAVLRGGQQYYLSVLPLVSSRLTFIHVLTKASFSRAFADCNHSIFSVHPAKLQEYACGILITARGFNVMSCLS
ncbi:hypothetical protein AGABI2DRAFT_114765 [Agaricus bisporus var. bisporus H97]|uniref:hypothetical protein n=1 Tax=Agaricus bisporus var. bisporus (strain H97 / ATCC MYA-4626 / FGSC 10389) TaxID=936046 RepID=UPI00029F591A|nr:hypothetical protein AGABI2DRAFT_114765 [Agaricus bisporus var. bisporus H97]EKV49674.1 hypothetical protein AGABI2DRAFT_114765 [Agaricus bisporus var. bisporus H97]